MKRRISKCAQLPCLNRLQIDRVQIQAAAKHIVAAGDDHGLSAAFAFLNLVEGQMNGSNDSDVDGIADR